MSSFFCTLFKAALLPICSQPLRKVQVWRRNSGSNKTNWLETLLGLQREMEAPEAVSRFITLCFAIGVSTINRQSIARACAYLPPHIWGNCDVLAEQMSVIMPASCTMHHAMGVLLEGQQGTRLSCTRSSYKRNFQRS